MFLCGAPLTFSERINHLGHIIHYTLDDSDDICRASSDLSRKANYLLHVFLDAVHKWKRRLLPVTAYPCMDVCTGSYVIRKSKPSKSRSTMYWEEYGACTEDVTLVSYTLLLASKVCTIIIMTARVWKFVQKVKVSSNKRCVCLGFLMHQYFLWLQCYKCHGVHQILHREWRNMCRVYVRGIWSGLIKFDSPATMRNILETICIDWARLIFVHIR